MDQLLVAGMETSKDTNLKFGKVFHFVDNLTFLGYTKKESGYLKPYEGVRITQVQSSAELGSLPCRYVHKAKKGGRFATWWILRKWTEVSTFRKTFFTLQTDVKEGS